MARWKIEHLGDSLHKITITGIYWSPASKLTEALLNLQGLGKVITSITRVPGFYSTYLVCTQPKREV